MIDVNNLVGIFAKKDEEINEILTSLVEDSDMYSDNQNENLKRTIAMEFKMFRLRTLVVRELVTVKQILSNNELKLNNTILSLFKKREVYLVSVNSRLTEMRDDFNSIQKIVYVEKMNLR